jgi:hypothetical protein
MSIEWIKVGTRVPTDRHRVLVWGRRWHFAFNLRDPIFLGTSRFNPAPSGGRFDCEIGRFGDDVTHWAEIVGPEEGRPEAPVQPPGNPL